MMLSCGKFYTHFCLLSSAALLPHGSVLEGQVVGEGAQPIGTGSVGHQLLQSLGWVPGTGLGPSGNGIRDPIHAVMRRSKQGLGH